MNEEVKHSLEEKAEITAREITLDIGGDLLPPPICEEPRGLLKHTTDAVLDQANVSGDPESPLTYEEPGGFLKQENVDQLLLNKWILRGCLIAAIAASACLILTSAFPIG